MPVIGRHWLYRRRSSISMAAEHADLRHKHLKHRRRIMSKHEQHAGRSATATGKEGGCCGGARDHGSAKPETNAAEPGKKPSAASQGPHTHSAHATGGSCGCGDKYK
jgi:hypothetical protein